MAAHWEEEVRLAYSQQIAEGNAPLAPVYAFDTFVNKVRLPLCVRDGSHRPATVAMYTNILKVIIHAYVDYLFCHTFAQKYLIDCGGDAFTLQKLLGHSALAMTKHHYAIFDADLAKNYNAFTATNSI